MRCVVNGVNQLIVLLFWYASSIEKCFVLFIRSFIGKHRVENEEDHDGECATDLLLLSLSFKTIVIEAFLYILLLFIVAF